MAYSTTQDHDALGGNLPRRITALVMVGMLSGLMSGLFGQATAIKEENDLTI